jgi:hypothetical protein
MATASTERAKRTQRTEQPEVAGADDGKNTEHGVLTEFRCRVCEEMRPLCSLVVWVTLEDATPVCHDCVGDDENNDYRGTYFKCKKMV